MLPLKVKTKAVTIYSLCRMNYFLPFLGWRGTKSTITEATTGLLYQSPMMMVNDDECGEIGRMIGKENLFHCSFAHHKFHMA
jgi:hypothetical protein